MYAQLLLDPYLARLDAISPVGPHATRAVLVMDNVGFHKCLDVIAAFKAIKVAVQDLPPNCTQQLQPMDLVRQSAPRGCVVNLDYFADGLMCYRCHYHLGCQRPN